MLHESNWTCPHAAVVWNGGGGCQQTFSLASLSLMPFSPRLVPTCCKGGAAAAISFIRLVSLFFPLFHLFLLVNTEEGINSFMYKHIHLTKLITLGGWSYQNGRLLLLQMVSISYVVTLVTLCSVSSVWGCFLTFQSLIESFNYRPVKPVSYSHFCGRSWSLWLISSLCQAETLMALFRDSKIDGWAWKIPHTGTLWWIHPERIRLHRKNALLMLKRSRLVRYGCCGCTM